MYLTPRDEEILQRVSVDLHVSIQAAAYTTYLELTPANKKPISQREFHSRFRDNWEVFLRIENEGYGEA